MIIYLDTLKQARWAISAAKSSAGGLRYTEKLPLQRLVVVVRPSVDEERLG